MTGRGATAQHQSRESVTPNGAIRPLRVVPADGSGFEDEERVPAGSHLVPGMPDWRYVPAGDERAGLYKSAAGGKWKRALDWCPAVVERLVLIGEDGTPSALHYLIRIGVDELIVTHESVRKGECWDRFPAAYGLAGRTAREVVANVVAHQAQLLVRTAVVDRTGGHMIAGQRVYVRPDGRTVPEGAPVRLVGVPGELARLAGPLDSPASGEQMRGAVRAMMGRGWAPLLGLGIGARSAGWSIVPVRAGYLAVGDPGSGKSLTCGCARWLYQAMVWPPLPTASFTASVTEIEYAINAETDYPTVLEDLALVAGAHSGEVKEATGKIERIFRPLANDTEIRGRRNKDLTKKPSTRVRSIVGANMQRVPHTVQESLYRRMVVLYLDRGAIDTKWYEEHSATLLGPYLRTIGDHVLAVLWAGDETEARERLTRYDAAGYHLLGVAMDQVAPGWADSDDHFRGVVKAAGTYVGGLHLIADAVGIDFAELAAVVVDPLARSLVHQWAQMRDTRSATDDLAAAVGEVISKALAERHAHIRDTHDVANPCVPGQSPTVQGLRDLSRAGYPAEWEGQGFTLYWIEDHEVLGISGRSLHSLLASYGDPRTAGYTALSLPEALLKAGGSMRSDQRGSSSTHQKKINGKNGPRLVFVRAALVFDLPEPEAPEARPSTPAPAPVPIIPEQRAQELPTALPLPQAGPCGAGCGFDASDTWHEGVPWHNGCLDAHLLSLVPAQVSAPVTVPPAKSAPEGKPSSRGRKAAPELAPDPDGPGLAEQAANIRRALKGVGRAIDEPMARAVLGEWLAATNGTHFVDWFGDTGISAYARLRAMSGGQARGIAGAQRIESELAAAMSADAVLHLDFVNPDQVPALGQAVTEWDVNGQFLSAAAIELGHGEPVHVKDPRSIKGYLRSPGYLRLASDLHIPSDLLPHTRHAFAAIKRGRTLASTTARYLVGRGVELDVSEVVTWPQPGTNHRRHLDAWVRLFREARKTLLARPGEPAVLALVVLKGVASVTIGGWLRSAKNRSDFMRRDWSDQIIAEAWVRALVAIDKAGEAGNPVMGMRRDSAWFLAADMPFEPAGLTTRDDAGKPATQLGKWKLSRCAAITEDIITAHAGGSAEVLNSTIKAAHEAREGRS